jgi:hypothetical protein
MCGAQAHVRYGPKADIGRPPERGHQILFDIFMAQRLPLLSSSF